MTKFTPRRILVALLLAVGGFLYVADHIDEVYRDRGEVMFPAEQGIHGY